jgi:hypothetical protein
MSIKLDPSWMQSTVSPNLVQPPEHFYRVLHYYRRKWRPWTYLLFGELEDVYQWIEQQKAMDLEFVSSPQNDKYKPHEQVRIIKISAEIVDNLVYKLN